MAHSSHGGDLMSLVEAAVPLEVRKALAVRLGSEEDLQDLLQSLASPPRTVCLRLTAAGEDGQDEEIEAALSQHLAVSRSQGEAQFALRRCRELPAPMCWLQCPEVRLVAATLDDGFRDTFSMEQAGDAIIDAACAMAVLRGADVFSAGVMATSTPLDKGQAVRLWVVPAGTRQPTRGSILTPGMEAMAAFPAVLVAGGEAMMSRGEIFAAGAKGVAFRTTWRQGTSAPLAPMSEVLRDDALQGRALLQQLPSCAAARALAPEPGDRVLDMCAAPGGKTSHLAQLLFRPSSGTTSDRSLLVAVDRSLQKVRRVASLCAAHGFPKVQCVATDSRYLCKEDMLPSKNQPDMACGKAEIAAGETVAVEAKVGAEDETQVIENLAEDDSVPWPSDVQKAFAEAVAAHGSDRFRSHKRIWKAIIGAVGRGRISRLQVQAQLRKLSNSQNACDQSDAESQAPTSFPPEFFDRILADVPCSAMGQRPLLRWDKTMAEVCQHAEYQRHFLRTASLLLRPGGTLVYSTCTLTAEENEENISWALASLPLELEDARAAVFRVPPDAADDSLAGMAGLSGCGLDDEARQRVLRFDPRAWEVGFFIARFRKQGA